MKRYKIPMLGRLAGLIVLLSLLSSIDCQAKRKSARLPVIKFTEVADTFRFTDYFSHISCLQLGKTGRVPLGKVRKIIDVEGYLIVLAATYEDSKENGIFVFDRDNGRYLWSIGKRGEVPEEDVDPQDRLNNGDYLDPQDICYNNQEKTIMVFDWMWKEFISYRLDGEYVGRNKPDGDIIYMHSAERAPDGTMLISNEIVSGIGSQKALGIIKPGSWDPVEMDPFAPVVLPHVGFQRRSNY